MINFFMGVLFVVCIVVILLEVFPIVHVDGISMFPTYNDDDLLISYRLCKKRDIKVGDVVVAERPDVKKRYVIKRVSLIGEDPVTKKRTFYLLGDNSNNSLDSRHFGGVSEKLIVSKIIYPYRMKEELPYE
ncbi:MAG: S26 family signal peptidase [Cellulosilyticum sp.]|nr:S26 family signal peptidase [Cellulosilyticum sp.]